MMGCYDTRGRGNVGRVISALLKVPVLEMGGASLVVLDERCRDIHKVF